MSSKSSERTEIIGSAHIPYEFEDSLQDALLALQEQSEFENRLIDEAYEQAQWEAFEEMLESLWQLEFEQMEVWRYS